MDSIENSSQAMPETWYQAKGMRHIVVPMPIGTNEALKERAQRAGLSLRAFCTELIEEFLAVADKRALLRTQKGQDRARMRVHVPEGLHRRLQDIAQSRGAVIGEVAYTAMVYALTPDAVPLAGRSAKKPRG